MATNFNLTHPELKAGEVFLGNFAHPIAGIQLEGDNRNTAFEELPYGSKRKGNQAFTTAGEELNDHAPVFVSRVERDARVGEVGKPKPAAFRS